MSSFVPNPLDDCPPPLGEEPNHPQDPGETNFVISEVLQVVVNSILAMLYCVITQPYCVIAQLFRFVAPSVLDPLDDTIPPSSEELSHTEHPQDQAEIYLMIRATDLTLGLRRVPAGFHVTVQADGAEWQTSNKSAHVDQPVVEWNERILLPSEPSSKVRVKVYASFELDPMLSHGDLLRTFEISVGNYWIAVKGHNPKAGEVVSPCTSLLMTVEQRRSDKNETAVLRPLSTLTSSDMQSLILMTDAGHRLLARYRRTQNSRDLDQSITHFERACHLCPVDNPCRPAALFNLATAKFVSCQVNGTYLDLDFDIPISLFEEALDMRPTGHTDRPLTQLHLSIALLSRFAKRGFQADADAAKELLNEVRNVSLADSHLSRAALLAIETSAFARSTNTNALEAEEPIASMLPWSPNGLARRAELCLRMDEVISLHYDALGYYSTANDQRGQLLDNLSIMLATRWERRGNDQDLDEAIVLQKEGLALHPVGHTDRSLSLNNLAKRLSTRFEHRGNDQDLDEAIVLSREALTLQPVGHTNQSSSLNNLASHLSTRFQHRGNDRDLEESLENLRCALTLLTQRDPRQLLVRRSLASVYLLAHQSGLGEDTEGLNAAMHHLKAAANSVSGGLLARLRTSLRWVHHAHKHSHGTELEAYVTSMQLLDTFMSATASVSSRHDIMKEFPSTLAVNAASCSLRCGDVCRAVELLEQGRTLIWTQMARFRTPLDSLQDRGAHAEALMKKFRDLSSVLGRRSSDHSEGTSRVDVEAEATGYRRLVEEWNTALQDIRKIEGFDHFLLAPLFSELQGAARDGPIIILIASKLSCDAIIVPHHDPPITVGLAITVGKLVQLVYALQRTVRNEQETQAKLVETLRQLWVDVVNPVVENLARVAERGSRIWWCPTSLFNFLPLHAAGEYKGGGKSLSQLYISSYTPSLTALIQARKRRDKSLLVSFAAIGQNHPPEHKHPLACVESELDLVQSLLPLSPTISFTKVTSADSTKSVALRALRDNHWVHFACHGTQNLVEPFKSAFLMRDKQLQLQDISHADLSRHEFAFLSACQTAVGDFETPDEAIHLAAGLQFSGVKSVVGTFWNVDNITVQRLVEAFYKEFCGDGKMNSKRAARALHKAVQSLKDLPLDQRIVFMHIGV